MRLGFSFATEEVIEEMKTLETYVDFFEIYSRSDTEIESVKGYIDKIAVVHLPDLNKGCVQALERAAKLDIEKGVVHYFTVDPWSHEKKLEELRKLVGIAEENDIVLCLENTEENPREITKILDKIPNLWFCLDTGHGNIFGNTPSDFITHLGELVQHVHIHDNHGGNSEADDIHLIPGEGNIDFDKTLQDLEKICYNGDFTLELVPMDSDERKIHGLRHTRALLDQFYGGLVDGLG